MHPPLWTATIIEPVPSGKNSRIRTASGRYIPSQAVRHYYRVWTQALQDPAWTPLNRPLALIATIGEARHGRRDLDNQLATLCDALAQTAIITNDTFIDLIIINRVRAQHCVTNIALYPAHPHLCPSVKNSWATFTIPGQVPPGKNSPQTIVGQGWRKCHRSNATARYLADFAYQVPRVYRQRNTDPTVLKLHLIDENRRRRDLDNQISTISDALVLAHVLQDDALITRIIASRELGTRGSARITLARDEPQPQVA